VNEILINTKVNANQMGKFILFSNKQINDNNLKLIIQDLVIDLKRQQQQQ